MLVMALEAIARAHARLSRLDGRPESAVWHPITTSKRVVAVGHVLREHHDGFQRITLRPNRTDSYRGRQTDKVLVSEVKRLVRVDDRVRTDRGHLAIILRGDENGAQLLCDRLQAQLPDSEHIYFEAQYRRASQSVGI